MAGLNELPGTPTEEEVISSSVSSMTTEQVLMEILGELKIINAYLFEITGEKIQLEDLK